MRCEHEPRTKYDRKPLLLAALLTHALHGCAGVDEPSEETASSGAPFPTSTDRAENTPFQSPPGAQPSSEEDFLYDNPLDSQKATSPQSTQSNARIFRWTDGNPDVYMMPTSTHLCFLTQVTGHFADYQSRLAVHRSSIDLTTSIIGLGLGFMVDDNASSVWKIGGTQIQHNNSLSGEGTCVPLTDFRLEPGEVIWSSRLMNRSVSVDGGGEARCDKTTMYRDLWWGNAVSAIQGLQGRLGGGGEEIKILPSANFNTPSQLRVSNQTCWAQTKTEGVAMSFFIGHPDQPGTDRTKLFSRSSTGGAASRINMIPTRSGVCFLTRISGKFNGSEERIRILPTIDGNGKEWWTLETHAGGGKAYGEAQCIYYNQVPACSDTACI